MSHITHTESHKELLVATAITTSIALAALYLPVVGFLVSVFIPLPVLFFRSKLGRPRGALILVAVTVIVGSTMHWRSITSALVFFELGLVGLILSEVFELDLSLEKTVVVTTGVVVATGIVLLAFYGLASTDSLWEQISNYMHRNFELALTIYREMDVSEERVGILAQSMDGIIYVLLRIMPAIAIVSTLLVVWSNLLVARPLLRSSRLFYPDFGCLNEWKAPEPMVWLVILSGVLLLIPHKGLKILGVNGLIIMMVIYFFQGIAVVSFYFEKKQFPKILRGVLYGLIALQQLVLVLVIAAGLFDVWIDFRRMNKAMENQDEDNT